MSQGRDGSSAQGSIIKTRNIILPYPYETYYRHTIEKAGYKTMNLLGLEREENTR
jgi:hypothetical protein